MQGAHEGAPSPLTVPSIQVLHDDAAAAEKVPGEQRVQLPDFSLEKDPASHDVHEPSPMLLFVPELQLIQAVPASLGTLPAVQKEQEEDPGVSEILPIEHIEHSSVPPTLYFDIGQLTHEFVILSARFPKPQ